MQKLISVRRAEADARQLHRGPAEYTNESKTTNAWLEGALARLLIRATGNLPMRVQVGAGPIAVNGLQQGARQQERVPRD